MERRDRALKALNELNIIDSLEVWDKPSGIKRWVDSYLGFGNELFDGLEKSELERASELMFRNINFLKQHAQDLKSSIDENKQIRKFFS